MLMFGWRSAGLPPELFVELDRLVGRELGGLRRRRRLRLKLRRRVRVVLRCDIADEVVVEEGIHVVVEGGRVGSA